MSIYGRFILIESENKLMLFSDKIYNVNFSNDANRADRCNFKQHNVCFNAQF